MEPVREQEKERSAYQDREALIFFTDRDDRDWWDLFTRQGFRHCFMLQWCEWSNRWLMIDWRQKNTDCMILFDFEAEKFMGHMIEQKGTVVRYWPTNIAADSGPLVTYCSTLISRYLGLGDAMVLTPFRLYRMLIAAGGKIVYRWSDENE